MNAHVLSIAETMLDRVGDILAVMEADRAHRRAAICLLLCPARACKRAKACRHAPCAALTLPQAPRTNGAR